MKTRISILGSLVLLVAMSFAFTPFTPTPEYYEGKWNVLVIGTPNGDATIPMRFETKDGKTTGYVKEEGATEETEMTSVTISGDVINAAFFLSGYDLTLALKKVDENHANGDLLGMFDAEATRAEK